MDKKNKIEDISTLSPAQEGILLHTLLEPESKAYFIQIVLAMKGEFDITILQKSLDMLFEKNDILRTIFIYENRDIPVQIYLKSRTSPIHYEDIVHKADEEKERTISDYMLMDSQKGFELSKGSLLRLGVFKLDTNYSKAVLSIHHIITDGWSTAILIKKLEEIYNNTLTSKVCTEDEYSYRCYIKWLQRQDKEKALRFWKNYLNGYALKAPLMKFCEVGKKENKVYIKKEHQFEIGIECSRNLMQLARSSNITLNTLFQALWGILLQRYSNEEDVVFGVVTTLRPPEIPGVEETIGPFISTIPIRISNISERSFMELLTQLQNSFQEAERYKFCSLSEIQACSEANQDLVDHIVVFESYPLQNNNERKGGLLIETLKSCEQTNYNLNIMIYPYENIRIRIMYNEAVVDQDFIIKIEGHLKTIIKSILEKKNEYIKNIDILTASERRQIAGEFNNTQKDLNIDIKKLNKVHEIFECRVEEMPNETAITSGSNSLTYRELNKKSNQLARLMLKKGVRPGDIVGILLERSPEMIIGILAILKTGCAYLPLEPNHPRQRLELILKDSNTGFILTVSRLQEVISFEGVIIDIDQGSAYAGLEENNLGISCCLEDMAYILYTSGSTGKPKGVMVEHKSVLNILRALQIQYPMEYGDVFLLKTSYTFDVSVTELFGWFFGRGRVAILEAGGEKDPEIITNAIIRNKITHINFVPSMLNVLLSSLEEPELAKIKTLRYVFSAGEALTPALVLKFYKYMEGVRLENLYGPTEATIYATGFSINRAYEGLKDIPIGKPLANIRAYILDKSLNLQPIGIPGELCLTGSCLARGYLNNTELTTEKFINTRVSGEEVLYRTGDLAVWTKDGNIVFRGRMDSQVKVRGYRIELGEIEQKLALHQAVEEAVVLADTDTEGSTYLCAYIVYNKSAEKPASLSELKQYLLSELPEYMLPLQFVELEKMPLNSSGKIDRKALLSYKACTDRLYDYTAPETKEEEAVAAIFSEILGISNIGACDSFISLGGHSLKAAQTAARLRNQFNIQIGIRDILQNPTVEQLGKFMKKAAVFNENEIPLVSEKEFYETTEAQKSIWFDSLMEESGALYNTYLCKRIEGNLEIDNLNAALKEVIQKHESLRTTFELIDGNLIQRVQKKITVEFIDSRIEPESDKIAENIIRKEIQRPFDLLKGPLIRAFALKAGDGQHIILLVVHHIVSDALSLKILEKELFTAYNAITEGKSPYLGELRIQYKDFASWQNQALTSISFEKQKDYWIERFREGSKALKLPIDRPKPDIRTFKGDCIRYEIPMEIAAGLRNICDKNNATLFMGLAAIINILLYKYSKQSEITIGTDISGRNAKDLEGLIGLLINTVALKTYIDEKDSFSNLISKVRQTILEAYENQNIPFSMVVKELNLKRDLSRSPLFDVMLTLYSQNAGAEEKVKGLTISKYEIQSPLIHFDMLFNFVQYDEYGIKGSIHFNADLFKIETIELMKLRLIKLMENILENINTKLENIDFEIAYESDESSAAQIDFDF